MRIEPTNGRFYRQAVLINLLKYLQYDRISNYSSWKMFRQSISSSTKATCASNKPSPAVVHIQFAAATMATQRLRFPFLCLNVEWRDLNGFTRRVLFKFILRITYFSVWNHTLNVLLILVNIVLFTRLRLWAVSFFLDFSTSRLLGFQLL